MLTVASNTSAMPEIVTGLPQRWERIMNAKTSLAALFLLAAISSTALAQEKSAPPPKRLAIRAGHLIDGKSLKTEPLLDIASQIADTLDARNIRNQQGLAL